MKIVFCLSLYLIGFTFFLSAACAQVSHTESPQPLDEINANESFNFSVISDLNRSYGSTIYSSDVDSAIHSIISKNGTNEEVSLVLSTGDMVAGQKQGLNYKAMWSAFHKKVTNPLTQAGIAFAPSPGNHDASIDPSFQKERREYSIAFQNKTPSVLLNSSSEKLNSKLKILEGSQFPFYYAFTFKGGLFVSLDATGVGPISNEQIKFLEGILIQNKTAKFKIVFGHMPLYPFSFFRAHEYMAKGSPNFFKEFEMLLETHKVNYFLSGHHHAYYPGHRNGFVNYVSVPLLGSGARALLNPGNSVLSKTAFLNFNYDPSSGLSMKAINAKTLAEIPINSVPEMVAVPLLNSGSCTGCASMPTKFFINESQRALYLRSDK